LAFSGCSKKPQQETKTINEAVILSKEDFLKVESSELLNAIQSTGELKALTESTVNSEVNGNVLKILVEEGQKVSKGQTLALIDSRDLQDQLTQSKEQQRKAVARRDLAKITLERKDIAFKEDLISKQELDTNQTEFQISQRDLESANAQVSLSKANLNRAVVKSPIFGTISRKVIKTGELAQIGKELFGIVQTNPLKITMSVPNQFSTQLKLGQKILASLSAIPDQQFEGHISRINPVADQSSGTIEVSAEIDNSSERLKIGLLANCQILLTGSRKTITLPREAIIKEGKNNYIYLLQDDGTTVLKTQLEIKAIDKENTKFEITAGLSEGQTVVGIPLERNEKNLKVELAE
jgi:membrane fusion protein, multidrug efflux system